jgi:hypothetical protein
MIEERNLCDRMVKTLFKKALTPPVHFEKLPSHTE